MVDKRRNWQLVSDYNKLHYQCGLSAGDVVWVRKDIFIEAASGERTGEVFKEGELWRVLKGTASDPGAVWFRRPNGKRTTWSDDETVFQWFEKVDPTNRL